MESGKIGIQTKGKTKKMLHKFCGLSDLCYLCKQIKLIRLTTSIYILHFTSIKLCLKNFSALTQPSTV